MCDRIDFLLTESNAKEHLKLTGKMYRAKLPTADKFNTICSLQSDGESSNYFINGKEIFKADPLLDLIIGKLNLMYGVRQSYSLEGHCWKSETDLMKCFTISGGGEAVNILIQVASDDILEKVFPDFMKKDQESKVKLVELEGAFENEIAKYFDIIVQTVKLNL